MAKFQITMVTTNARDWDWRDGLREVVQNYLDGHDRGYTGSLTFRTFDGREYACFENKGYVLPKSAWLIGKSDKTEEERGRHGDGLPTGTLVLVREGVPVFFLNGSEKWVPTIEAAEQFDGEDILTITTRAGSARQNDFTVCVGITRATWETVRNRYLPFSDVDVTKIRSGGLKGDLIEDPAFKGQIFVKGIWTCNKPEFAYGVNLRDRKLDRDRRIIDTWDVQYDVAQILVRLSSQDDAMLDVVFDHLVTETGDVEGLHFHDGDIRDGIAARFAARFGEKAVAVDNAAEATKVEHFGLKGVVVPAALRKIMVHAKGTVTEIVARAVETNGAYVQDSELGPADLKAWTLARNLLVLAGVTVDPEKVRLFDFGKVLSAPRGTYNPATGEVRINPTILNDGPRALVTLAHELAHEYGSDGTLDHRAREERILADVIGTLLGLVDADWLAA